MFGTPVFIRTIMNTYVPGVERGAFTMAEVRIVGASLAGLHGQHGLGRLPIKVAAAVYLDIGRVGTIRSVIRPHFTHESFHPNNRALTRTYLAGDVGAHARVRRAQVHAPCEFACSGLR